MEIELLYFEGCPNHKRALRVIKEVLDEEGLNVPVKTRKVKNVEEAVQMRFLGSPTVRVDGRDVEKEARKSLDFGMKCRIYRVESGIQGYPSRRMIREAIKEAKSIDAHPSGPS